MKVVVKVPKCQVGILEGEVYKIEYVAQSCEDCVAINLKNGDRAILFPGEYVVLREPKPKSKIQRLLKYLRLRF